MPRSFARITTTIWRDRDFTNLTMAQQGLYFMLESQSEISAAGTLALTVRRWSKNASDLTPELLEQELRTLESEGHVCIDEDTEELLVRTFIKWDGGYENSKRRPVIRDAALAIQSPRLRAVVAAELTKLGLPDMASQLALNSPPDTPPDSPSNLRRDTVPDAVSDAITPSERVGVTLGEYVGNPLTATRNPQSAIPEREPSSGASDTPDEELSPHCSTHQPNGTDQPCGPCRQARASLPQRLDAAHRRASERASAAAHERARLRKAEIANCQLCDSDGRRPTGDGVLGPVCDHIHREPGARARAEAAVQRETRTA